ncbi:hypothetical protein NDU88_008162 [Pleurodeles waltl]|uniref:Uncharacterized protein n=1 Tax=Pleurodeles waltl TaxID=8319 RepID=A0AAV7QPZ2_PLEWA|nr:hypothetical protein NDU88_008162 [Pleurodeles waltl]
MPRESSCGLRGEAYVADGKRRLEGGRTRFHTGNEGGSILPQHRGRGGSVEGGLALHVVTCGSFLAPCWHQRQFQGRRTPCGKPVSEERTAVKCTGVEFWLERVLRFPREMCGVLPHPRAGGLHGDAERILVRSPWRGIRRGRKRRLEGGQQGGRLRGVDGWGKVE